MFDSYDSITTLMEETSITDVMQVIRSVKGSQKKLFGVGAVQLYSIALYYVQMYFI